MSPRTWCYAQEQGVTSPWDLHPDDLAELIGFTRYQIDRDERGIVAGKSCADQLEQSDAYLAGLMVIVDCRAAIAQAAASVSGDGHRRIAA